MKKVLCILLITLLCFACVSALADQDNEYYGALRLFQQRRYQEASAAFGSLSGYLDSDIMAIYSSAVSMIDAGEYSDAISNFRNLDGFKMSEWYISYTNARAMEANSETLAAIDAFGQLGAFLDSIQRKVSLQEKLYRAAKAKEEAGQYLQAKWDYLDLKGYGDSAERAAACQYAYDDGIYRSAEELEQKGEYLEAKSMFLSNPKHRDSVERAAACQYAYDDGIYSNAEELAHKGQYWEAKEMFLSIAEHRDSAQRAESYDQLRLEAAYQKANEEVLQADYTSAVEIYRSLGAYKDSASLAEQYKKSAVYQSARQLETESRFDDAINKYFELGTYKDSAHRIAVCLMKIRDAQYWHAIDLFANEQYAQAETLFHQIGDYALAADYLALCRDVDKAPRYLAALEAQEAGKMWEAYSLYTSLGSYEQSLAKLSMIHDEAMYQQGLILMDDMRWEAAIQAFRDSNGYSDWEKHVQTCSAAITYDQAGLLMAGGKFRDALALYDSIIQYSDSALLAEQCRNAIAYQEAVVLEQAKDYAAAIKMYKAAQGYADSQMRLTVCTDAYNAQTYYKALDLERSGDFAMAMKYYRALGDYADSARRLSVCEEAGYAQIYSEAQVLEGKGEFKAARDLYVLMPQYRDSAERVKTCDEMLYDAKYIQAAALLADGSYQEALDIYMLLNGYKDSAQLVIFCGNKLTFISAETHQNEMRWIEAYEEFSSLGDFEEAASRAENCLEQIYREAKLQEENQDYQQAVKSYLLLSKYGYKDSSVLALYCQNMLSYLAAEELYLSSSYQAAETSFLALGEFLDARIKAGEARKILNRQALSDALSSVEQGDFTILLEMLDSSRQLDKETRDQLINSAGSIIIDLFKEADVERAEAILAKLPEKKMIMDTALALEQSDPLLASRIWGGLLESDADTAKAALLRIAKDAGTAQLAAKSNSYALLGDMMAAGSLYLPYQSDLVSSYNDRTIMVQHDGKLFINNVSKKETAEAIKWKNITAAAIGEKFIASLQDTGAVKIAGDLKNKAVINKWTKIIRISAGGSHLAGLTEEGTVVSAGIKDGRIDVSSWTGISAISSAGSYTLGLTNKGTVLIAGAGSSTKLKAITDTWTDIVGIAACTNNICYGLKSDGTVVAASLFLGDGADLSPFHDIVAISGRNQSPGLIALRADGALLQLKSFIKGEAVTISYPESAGYVYAASTMNGWIALGSDGNTYTKAVPYKSISLLFKPQIRQQGGM